MPTLLDTRDGSTAHPARTSRDWPGLLTTFDLRGARYRVLPHAPESRVEEASRLRGSSLAQSARCRLVRVRRGRRVLCEVLTVVPGDRTVDLVAVARLFGGTAATFTPPHTVEELGGGPEGVLVPFACAPGVELVVEPALLEHEEIHFNAGRLDVSVALRTEDYRRLARPTVARIAA
ncbi:YbaK/EbsC family protein [Streptomyces sp. NPDC052682]|uniref:YbaK/EbsC family protein n=1 Tax=Streptomyces sp. NPDC052682 TaxID=3154954 RepID=UPI00342142E0